jgi:hypothetical protein
VSRYARNKDGNHAAVVRVLEACGATVEAIESGVAGVPDLLVGIFGCTELVEVKDGRKPPSARRLNAAQTAWHRRWRGRPVRVVESVEDALALVAEMRGAMTRSEVGV